MPGSVAASSILGDVHQPGALIRQQTIADSTEINQFLQHHQRNGDFQDRMIAGQYNSDIMRLLVPLPSSFARGSHHSSTSVRHEVTTPSTTTGFTPDLVSDSSNSSDSSALPDGLPVSSTGVCEVDSDGAIIVPAADSVSYQCPFSFLSCDSTFEDLESWQTHCLSHFCGQSPPRTVSCPICTEFKPRYQTGEEAWAKRMEHLAAHCADGRSLRDAPFDQALIRYLWQKRILDDVGHKQLMSGRSLTGESRNQLLSQRNRGDDRKVRAGQRPRHEGKLRSPT